MCRPSSHPPTQYRCLVDRRLAARAGSLICSLGTYAMTFTSVAVTPGAVAPPLSLPAGHRLTEKGPPPRTLKFVRPFPAQDPIDRRL